MHSKNRLLQIPQNAHCFLFGPRQVGKSTLLESSFKSEKVKYYNLLIEREYTKFIADPSLLSEEIEALDEEISHIIIDEVQRIPALLNEVHYQIEKNKNRFFILSGSSARKLKRGQANMLGGRAWTRYLFPFTHNELGEDFQLNKALVFGTLPNIYLNELENSKELLKSYVDTYLTEEIKAEAITRNIGAFTRFLKLAASESGNLLNYSNIAREAACSNQLVKEYFQVLEDTLLGHFLQPYSKSARTRLVKHPKFYLFDNGVINALLKSLNEDIEEKTYRYGVLFEHFIINEVIRFKHYYKKDFELSFFRTSNGAEVDLIIEDGKNIYAIEIKSKEAPSKADLKGLFSFKEICPSAELICLSRAKVKRQVDEITIYPWQEFFMSCFN